MGAGCTATNCYNSSTKGFCMVRYPRDEVLKTKWLQAVGRPHWVPHKEARVCDVHFSQSQWIKFKSTLKPDAVPYKICICDVSVKRSAKKLSESYFAGNRSILRHDHPYAFFVKSACPVHDKLPATQQILKENCALQEELHCLQQKLQDSEKKGERQILASVENISRPTPTPRKEYSVEEIQRGLQLWFSMGSTAYEKLIETFPNENIPAIRSLNRHTEHIRLHPGLHSEIFEAMGKKFEEFSDPRDRDCSFVFDEMVLQTKIDYDPSTKTFFGYGTLPGQEKEKATKAECYMLRRTHKHWKQLIGYNLICKDGNDEGKKTIVIDMLKKAEEIDCHVISIVCDMGNRGLLKVLGFSTLKDSLKWCIPNPINPLKKLWCMPDPVHLYKSLKEMLCKNGFLTLPDDIVKEYGLPSKHVSLEHIQWLEKFQRDEDLQLVPCLTVKDLYSTHFSKMNVKSSHTVLGHATGAALKYLVLRGLVPQEFETTAWFIKLMIRWFQLMTSRSCVLAFGFKDLKKYDEAIEHMKLVVRVFTHSKIPGGWKPVQSHIIFASQAALEIQDFLLNERKYKFVLMGCFSTDVMENQYSLMRIQRPNPRPLEFKQRYKQLVISQYSQRVKSSQYQFDDAPSLIDTLLKSAKKVSPHPVHQPFDVKDYPWISSVPAGARPPHQDDILYRMCGYVIVSLQKRNILKCSGCVSGLRHNGTDPHPNSLVQHLMDFQEGAQFPASDEVYQILRIVEFNVLRWIPKLVETRVPLDNVIELIIKPCLSQVKLQTCHDIKDRILSAFTVMRYRQIAYHKLSPLDGNSAASLASKTAGGQYLTKRYNPNPNSNQTTPKVKRKRLAKKKTPVQKASQDNSTPVARKSRKKKTSVCKSPSLKRLLILP